MSLDNWIESELPYGWAGEWTCPNTTNFDHHTKLYREIVKWLGDNVNNHRSNTKWVKIGDCIYVQFRKKEDMAWFLLRYS